MSKLLFDEYPLIIYPGLATKIGLNEAIILQQITYWNNANEKNKSSRNFKDGQYWTFNSYENWHKQFPFWSVTTIQRIIASLERQNLIVTAAYNQNGYDRTKWYRVNTETRDRIETDSLESKIVPIIPIWHDGSPQVDMMEDTKLERPIPETPQRLPKTPDKDNDALFPDAAENKCDTVSPGIGNDGNEGIKRVAALPIVNPSFVGSVEPKNEEVTRCIQYFLREYKKKTKKNHPYLQDEQYQHCHRVLSDFAYENSYEYDSLCEVVDAYFANTVLKCNFRLNHFCTPGILSNLIFRAALY